MSWIESVATYLQSQSLGTKGTDLFIGMMPDTSVLTTLLSENSGGVIETNRSGIALYQPQLQIRVRGTREDYSTPHTRILAVQVLLAGLADQTLSGVHFLRFKPTSTVLSLGQDNNLRFEFSTNFEVTYE
jgi:hypothetical protein